LKFGNFIVNFEINGFLKFKSELTNFWNSQITVFGKFENSTENVNRTKSKHTDQILWKSLPQIDQKSTIIQIYDICNQIFTQNTSYIRRMNVMREFYVFTKSFTKFIRGFYRIPRIDILIVYSQWDSYTRTREISHSQSIRQNESKNPFDFTRKKYIKYKKIENDDMKKYF
jgi:hypothetical protein